MADAKVRTDLRAASAAVDDHDATGRALRNLLRTQERECEGCNGQGVPRGEVLLLPPPVCCACGGTGRVIMSFVAMMAFGGDPAARELQPAGSCPHKNEAPHCRYEDGAVVGCRHNYLCVPDDLPSFVMSVAARWGTCGALVAVAAAEAALPSWEELELDHMEARASKDLDRINQQLKDATRSLAGARRFFYGTELEMPYHKRGSWIQWRVPLTAELAQELPFLLFPVWLSTVYDWSRAVEHGAQLRGVDVIQRAVRQELVRFARFKLGLG